MMQEDEARQLLQQLLAVEKAIENRVLDLRVITERVCKAIAEGSTEPKALSPTNPDDNFSWRVTFRGRPMVDFVTSFGRLPDEADPGLGLARCQIVPLDVGIPDTTLDLARTGDASWEWKRNRQAGTATNNELSDAIFTVISARLDREFQRYRV
jgi:hypothetical protein